MTVLIAALASIVAFQYALIGVYVVPRLARLADEPGPIVRAAQWGAAAFFIGCGITHVGIAIHTVVEPPGESLRHLATVHILPHIAQVVGGAAFILIAWQRLDVRFSHKGTAARERVQLAVAHRLAAQQHVARILADAGTSATPAARLEEAVRDDLGWREARITPAGRGEDLPAGLSPLAAAAWDTGRVGWSSGESGAETLAAVPLAGRTGVLGILEVHGFDAGTADAGELDALTTIGRLIGSHIERSRADAQRDALLASEQEALGRAHRAEQRASFLAEAGPLLAASLDVGSTAATVARLAVPDLGDWCAVDVLDAEGTPRRLAIAHADRTLERRAWELANRDLEPDAAVRRTLAAGASVLVPAADEALVQAGLIDERQLTAMRALSLHAALAVPMQGTAGMLGVISIGVGGSGRAFGAEDVAVCEALADRAAQGLINARLFEGERTARDAAQRAMRDLEEAEERFRTAFEHAPIGVALVSLEDDSRGRLLEVNPAMSQITGHPQEELLERRASDLTHPDDREADNEALRAFAAGELPELRREKRYVHANGHVVWVQVRATAVPTVEAGGRYAVAQIQDITDRKRYEGQLQHLADHDALTGLYNRRRFVEELNRAVANARRFGEAAAVLVIDLDNFKYVNDTYGHAAGDDLLGRVAGAMGGRLRATDVIGRLGGDEFAAILPRTTPAEARRAAELLVEAIRAEGTITIGERQVRATASIGINSVDPKADLTAEELLVEADLAMYDAKEAGRDRIASVAPGEASRAKMKARMTWSERIREALEHDGFELWEQPILAIGPGLDDRSELLVRMIDPDGDAIPPGVFLYIAERFGQIQAVDRWVIDKAIRLLADRRARGHDRTIEVNLSGASITDEATIDFIAQAIAAAPIDPTRLVFEVTETTAIVNVERARRFAGRLSDLGCQFALDDFGAGFGSFYYLKHLPFDCVKIDGDFVKDLPASPPDQLTVKAIVQIAKGLGKDTVAEFVQDERTVELLREYGVDYAQGYHIGRPRPARDRRFEPGVRLPA